MTLYADASVQTRGVVTSDGLQAATDRGKVLAYNPRNKKMHGLNGVENMGDLKDKACSVQTRSVVTSDGLQAATDRGKVLAYNPRYKKMHCLKGDRE